MLKLFHGVDSNINCVCKIQKKHFRVLQRKPQFTTHHITRVYLNFICKHLKISPLRSKWQGMRFFFLLHTECIAWPN